MSGPHLLRGVSQIATALGISNRAAAHLVRQNRLPVFRVVADSALHATAAGLADWVQLYPNYKDGPDR